MRRPVYVAVDFDATLCARDHFPEAGPPLPGAVRTMWWLQRQHGVRLILLTMRNGLPLDNALEQCSRHHIYFWAVNENPEYERRDFRWEPSRKVYYDVLVDDRAAGTPLTPEGYVDWSKMPLMLNHAIAAARERIG